MLEGNQERKGAHSKDVEYLHYDALHQRVMVARRASSDDRKHLPMRFNSAQLIISVGASDREFRDVVQYLGTLTHRECAGDGVTGQIFRRMCLLIDIFACHTRL